MRLAYKPTRKFRKKAEVNFLLPYCPHPFAYVYVFSLQSVFASPAAHTEATLLEFGEKVFLLL